MSTQIAVRLPDDLLAFVDELVADGNAANRAEAVRIALKQERRRRAAEREIEILRNTEPDRELEAWVRSAGKGGWDHLDLD